ncbi:MAG TPA: CBS domain-containing protein [Pseudonocardia sp.]
MAALLSTKPGDVRTFHPWSTVADAVRRLGEAPRVGALVVTSDRGRVIGLVGEREIVRGLGDHGPGLMQLSAENVMSRNIPTCAPVDTLAASCAPRPSPDSGTSR